jgi:peptide/nickel transport system permease protein
MRSLESKKLKKILIIIKNDLRLKIVTVIILIFSMVAVFAPLLAPYSPTNINLKERLLSPSLDHLLGTDKYGRDVLSRLIYGARISLIVGSMVVLISAALGMFIGTLSGYFGGIIDATIMRFVDVLLAFPGFLLALGMVACMGNNLQSVVIAIAVAYAPRNALIVRSVALSVRETDYMEAVKALGASHLRLITHHLVPNVIPSLIVIASIQAATAITAEAGFSFLGLGVQPPTPTWGAVIAEGREFVRSAPWISFSAGLSIMIVVLGLNLLGDALRDILDPRMRESENIRT